MINVYLYDIQLYFMSHIVAYFL